MSIRDLTINQWSETVTENLPTDGTFIGRDLAKHIRNFKSIVRSESLDKEFETQSYSTATAVSLGGGLGLITIVGEGDLTGIFTPMRKIRLSASGVPIYVSVDAAVYDGGSDTTTVGVVELTSAVAEVEYAVALGTPIPGASCLPQVYDSGQITITGASTSGTAIFSVSGMMYFAKTQVVSASGGSPSDVVTRIVKSAGSMDIHIKAAPGGVDTTVINWSVFKGMP